MTESTEKQTVAERASGLSDDLLESVDAGLGLADELSTAVMELLRSISRSAGEAVRGRPDETKG